MMNKFCSQLMSIAFVSCLLVHSNVSAAASTEPKETKLIYTGESIQPISKNHYRVKVEYTEATKMRCVGFAEDAPVAIDSVVVIPPFAVANMITNEADKPIDKVQCWVTSTRKEDLKRDYIKHDM